MYLLQCTDAGCWRPVEFGRLGREGRNVPRLSSPRPAKSLPDQVLRTLILLLVSSIPVTSRCKSKTLPEQKGHFNICEAVNQFYLYSWYMILEKVHETSWLHRFFFRMNVFSQWSSVPESMKYVIYLDNELNLNSDLNSIFVDNKR